jgi:cell division protein FtsQ
MEEFANIPKATVARKRWGVWVLIPLLLSVVVLFVFSMEWRETLRMKRLIVHGSRIIPVEEVFKLANVASNTAIFDIELAAVRTRVLSQPYFNAVTVSRQLPGTLAIDVVEREPVASITAGHALRYVDGDGVVLPFRPVVGDLPVISGIEGLQKSEVGQRAEFDDLTEALRILAVVCELDTALYHFVSEINMNHGGDIVIYSGDSGVPVLLGRGNIARKLALLRTFWASYVHDQEVNRLKYIDVRFDDQVVVKWDNAATGSKSSKPSS